MTQAAPGAVDESILQATAAQLGLARKTALKLLPAALFTQGSPDLAPEALRARAADALLSLLEQHEFRQAAVAQALDLSRTTLLKLVERLGLPRASALPLADIEAALAQHGQDVASTARVLRVSAEALRQRLALLRQ